MQLLKTDSITTLVELRKKVKGKNRELREISMLCLLLYRFERLLFHRVSAIMWKKRKREPLCRLYCIIYPI